MKLSEQLTTDIKLAMKAKDKERLLLLRSVSATFKNKEIDTREPLGPADEVALLLKMIKQRNESAEAFRKGGAVERAEKEEWEIEQLQAYLPPAPSESEIDEAIELEVQKLGPSERSPKAMGQIMKSLGEKFAGRPVDGKALSQRVRASLAG